MPPTLHIARDGGDLDPFQARRDPFPLPPEAGFLRRYGITAAQLEDAWRTARELACGVEDVLIASQAVSAARFYLCLADTLGLRFAESGVMLARVENPEASIRHGYARLAESPGFRGTGGWLIAPRSQRIRLLLRAKSLGLPLPRVTITTPAHLSILVRRVAASQMAEAASRGLAGHAPHLSARHALDALKSPASAGVFTLVLALFSVAPQTILLALGPLFLGAVALRAAICVMGFRQREEPPPLSSAALPLYGVVVALYREARMVPSLIRNLRALDYPAAKLDVKIVLEADDPETRAALEEEDLPPHFEIVIAPEGLPRTKPRALNIALSLLRAELVTIYDAEDRPEPGQLRKAAARFHVAPPDVACLQARLAIGTAGGRLLTKLFAIEYATLFDLFNQGIAAAGMPFALGGTSNHFRAESLRRAGGWDAWNVAEDADLGFRLTRFGYRVEMLASTTAEQAPPHWTSWFNQRRRWTKGWMQTILVLARHPRRTLREFGPGRTAVLVLLAVSLILGPLLSPLVATGLVISLTGQDPASFALACLWVPVLGCGTTTILWTSYVGITRAALAGCWLSLPLMVPYQILISAAAWGGLFDLLRAPYHWHKTEHYPQGGDAAGTGGTRPR